MITLSLDAQVRLESYLADVKASLGACGSVDADEVVRDLKEHISRELVEEPSPVAVSGLEKVLQRLGAPEQWVSAGQPPSYDEFFLRMRNGPSDWRLAYVSLGMMVLWILVGWIAAPLFVCLLLAAVLCARASLAVRHVNDSCGRKWLVYPPLIVFYVPLAIALVAWPLFLWPNVWWELWRLRETNSMVSLAETHPKPQSVATHLLSQSAQYPFRSLRLFGTPPDVSVGILSGVTVSIVTGLWWILLAFPLHRRPGWMQILFRPFAGWFAAWHAKILWVAGTLLVTHLGVLIIALFWG